MQSGQELTQNVRDKLLALEHAALQESTSNSEDLQRMVSACTGYMGAGACIVVAILQSTGHR